jgi:hypothetical protein
LVKNSGGDHFLVKKSRNGLHQKFKNVIYGKETYVG